MVMVNMEPGANLVEWMELLNEMLQFLDAAATATTAEMCSCSKKAIDGNEHCADGDLSCEEKCDRNPSPGTAQNGPRESAEYMNIVNEIDESRYTLVHKCRALLRKLEESSSSTATPQTILDEEENSYLEMGGVGHKNDINLTQQPPDKIDSGGNSESCCCAVGGDKEITSSCEPERNEAELNLEENCYDFTTDRCLYDECLDTKLNNTVNVIVPAEESTSSSSTKCPFSGLPAAHLRIKQSPKCGTLFRQEKRIFFDQTKKYYVGLLDRWLLLYNNSNELKPTQCVQVKDIKLDLSLNDQINEKSQFHIITQEDSKICFTSPSFKELNEWVVAIQQNLLAKPENSPRKLPLPPTPTPYTSDETDTAAASSVARIDSEESIYEEPQLLSKQRPVPPSTLELHNNYDTPKLTGAATTTDNHLSQQHLKATPTKIINDALISPKTTTWCEPISLPTVSPTVAVAPSTPVKSWIFNRFNKSPSSDSEHQPKPNTTTRKPPKKQLAFPAEPPTTPTSSVTVSSASANKGSKINMIISQLEANGQLSLLSKSLNDKRNTWCMEE